MDADTLERFNHRQYTIRRQVFKLLGEAFHVYGPAGQLVLYSKMKAFKLKEDIRLYTGEDMATELLAIRARHVIDFSAAYDVVDPTCGKVGALKRKGLKSLLRDEWIVMDEQDHEIGLVQEDSTLLALVRRFTGDIVNLLLPQQYSVQIGGMPVCTMRQNHNPFVFKLSVDFGQDTQGRLDRRLGLAAGILLAAVEGRQE